MTMQYPTTTATGDTAMITINTTTRDALILARESTGADLEVRAGRLPERFNIVRSS